MVLGIADVNVPNLQKHFHALHPDHIQISRNSRRYKCFSNLHHPSLSMFSYHDLLINITKLSSHRAHCLADCHDGSKNAPIHLVIKCDIC